LILKFRRLFHDSSVVPSRYGGGHGRGRLGQPASPVRPYRAQTQRDRSNQSQHGPLRIVRVARQLIFEASSPMFPDGAVQLPVQSTGGRCIWNENEFVFIDIIVETRKGLRLLNWHKSTVCGSLITLSLEDAHYSSEELIANATHHLDLSKIFIQRI
jgi:hypothetical protein